MLAAILGFAVLSGGAVGANAAPSEPAGPGLVASTSLDGDTVTPEELFGTAPAPQARSGPQSDFVVGAFAAAGHTVDVAVVAPAGTNVTPTFISDVGTADLVRKAGTYWTTQSNGQVQSLTASTPAPLRFSSPNACSALDAIWEEAGTAFGHPNLQYYVANAAHHLLVLVPDGCGGAGVGTLGSQLAPVSGSNGGLIWASLNGINNLDVVAHEFGHNLGLRHSNTHFCPDASISEGILDPSTGAYSNGCYDDPYQDAYDVMGAAFSFNGIANAQPTALNVTHKSRLDSLAAGEVQVVALPNGKTIVNVVTSLVTTGASSGRRALAISDPRSGRVYYVDYRGGGGADAGALYTSGSAADSVSPGVRIMTLREDGTSVLLLSPQATSDDGHKLFLAAGQSLSTRSGGVTIAVQGIASGVAQVQVTLRAVQSRLAGADRFSASAAISEKNFTPGVGTVYVANGLKFPDALSGAPVAAKDGAPILLVLPDSIPDSIRAELTRLKPAKIVVLGGESSVTPAVKTLLGSFTTGTVTRLSGPDRFSASAGISAATFATGVATVYVANGLKFPDALSGAPVAAKDGAPILLVLSDSIPDSIRAELTRLQPAKIVVLGGVNSVSLAVGDQLNTYVG